MDKKLAQQITDYFNKNDVEDVSTEKLLQMCVDEFNLEDCTEVIDALKMCDQLTLVK